MYTELEEKENKKRRSTRREGRSCNEFISENGFDMIIMRELQMRNSTESDPNDLKSLNLPKRESVEMKLEYRGFSKRRHSKKKKFPIMMI